MNGLQGRLGAVVELDALGLSGANFADLKLGSVRRRVKRRRAARSAGIGGASVLGVGSLVVGVTHLPFGSLGSAVPGGPEVSCTTTVPTPGGVPDPADPIAIRGTSISENPDTGTSWLIASDDGKEVLAMATLAGEVVTISAPDGTVQRVSQGADGAYDFTLAGEHLVGLFKKGHSDLVMTPVPDAGAAQLTARGGAIASPTNSWLLLGEAGAAIAVVHSDGTTVVFEFIDGDIQEFGIKDGQTYSVDLPDGTPVLFSLEGNTLRYLGAAIIGAPAPPLSLASAAPVTPAEPTVTCVTTTPEPSASANNTENPSPKPSSSPEASPSAMPPPTSAPEASSDGVFSPTPIAGTTPFQCGFEFLSDEHAADTFSVTGGKVPASQMQALLTERFGAEAPTLNADGANALMWRGRMVGDASASSVNAAAAESLSYVLAVDGIVIGTFEKGPDGAMDGVSVARDSDSASPEAFLWDKHGATSCPGVTGTVTKVQTWVVAGSTDAGEPIYAWKNITKD